MFFEKGIALTDKQIDLINYFDKHATAENGKISPFNHQKLMEEFPDIDEFSLRLWHNEWMSARNVMLNMKF